MNKYGYYSQRQENKSKVKTILDSSQTSFKPHWSQWPFAVQIFLIKFKVSINLEMKLFLTKKL